MAVNYRDKRKLVKVVSAEILVCVILSAAIGLLLLFNLIKGSNIVGNLLLTLLTAFISGLFFLNSVNAIAKGNKVGTASAIAIFVCAVLYIVLIWLGDKLGSVYTPYIYTLVILSMVSIFMNLVISNYIALGSKLLLIQIFLYIFFAYIETTLAFTILGNLVLINFWQIFLAAIIIAITLYVVLKVKQKNVLHDENIVKANGEEYVTITKTEYDRLKAAEERLFESEREKGTLNIPITDNFSAGNASDVNGINGGNGNGII